jgi:hypothetical protein
MSEKREVPMKKVVIVNAGGRGKLSAAEGSYDTIAMGLKRWFEEAESPIKPGTKIVEAVVVSSMEEAMEKFGTEVLVFLTAGMLEEARKFKRSHKDIKVIVLTGLIPEDEVIIVDKNWLPDKNLIFWLLRAQ